ncbi:major histocompatibility complex class I-related gene protein-like [Clupea harengus]|uniref:Major histocompatibility complex class I-related gene protein-like n=1 Tax=Clupea harengus TaxID=7950 RepID=A0A6P8GUB5_CLUHA|nr:major histocompatibility complex class I-related gene protein-like [Clupea harengus]
MKTNMTTATLLVVLCCFHVASGVTHTMQHFYTATSGIPNFPEFIIVSVVDGQQTVSYDSITKRLVPKAKWMAAAVDSDYWNQETEKAVGTEASFKNNVVVAKSRFNQTEGVHTYQNMYGCQWDDESQAVDGYDQYGYDGEDFISLDLKDLRYVAPNQQAVITKNNWDNDRAKLEYLKQYYTQTCIEWLKKYLQFGSSTLGRTVSPEVTLLQKDSRVVCHSTGFYPDGVMITLKRDGVDMHEDVDMGETLPNEDGTFQKRAELTVSLEGRKKGEFTCEVAHKSGKPIVKILIVEEGINLVGIIIGCVIAALVLIGVVVAIVMMKKKGYKKAGQSDSDSDTSDPKVRFILQFRPGVLKLLQACASQIDSNDFG